MVNILVVDDSKLITSAIKNSVINKLGFNCIVASSMKEAAELLLKYKGNFEVALLDLGLPDSQNGEIIDFITKFSIPSIVLTGSHENENKIRNKNIVDYVIKDGAYSLEYAVGVIKRIVSNKNLKALVVDDSKITCEKIASLLQRYQLQTYQAYSAKDCLEVLDKNPDIKVIYIDFLMPGMDGLSLTKEIRYKYSKDELSIIAISGDENKKLISKFLKYGANDFIYKGFTEEEFFVRLNSNLEILELFQSARNKANTDYLTGMYNRRYLFEKGEELFDFAKKNKKNFALAILDIDKFKSINDTYGHDIGDAAIKEVSYILSKYLSDSLYVRLGGEEFCCIIENKSLFELSKLFEKIRHAFEHNVIEIDNIKFSYTISIGVCNTVEDSLNKMMNLADNELYKAKKTGRNKVVFYES
jgi:diguanylate cyclase (GGDEF)-like protein